MFRVGFGQDSHRFLKNPDKKLILGGVLISGENGLEGNSDGDVVIHSICRALEQAVGMESFSIYADNMSKNGINNSKEYLKKSMDHVKDKGYKINNLGISLEGQKPKIADLADQMKKSLAEILEIEKNQIGISATSGEDLTAFGRGEGLQSFTIVSLIKNEAD